MSALQRSVVLRRNRCVEATGCTRGFVDFVQELDRLSPGSSGALDFGSAPGNRFDHSKVTCGPVLFRPISLPWQGVRIL
jgi:hypothetical protein